MAAKTFWNMFKKVVRQVWLTNTFNDDTEETENIKEDINDIQKEVLSLSKSYLTKEWVLISWWTVASQNNYDIPATVDKVTSVKITSWGVNYYPKEVSNSVFHAYDNVTAESDTPSIWTLDKTQLYIYPTPSSNSLPIELNANEYATSLVTDPWVTTDQNTALAIKEGYENVIYYYALSEAFHRLQDFSSADRYVAKFEKLQKKYENEVRSATNSVVVWGVRRRPLNPNKYPTLTN